MSRLRYSLYRPSAPRRYAGYLAGLLLAALAVTVVVLGGILAPMVTHAAASGIVAL